MIGSNEYFEVESRGQLGILRMKPFSGVALSDIDFTHDLLHTIEAFAAEPKSALLVTIPAGNFGAERVEAFWELARRTRPDGLGPRDRYSPAWELPLQVHRVENSVVQLLRLLHTVDLFKIIAVEGNVDFDLLGLLLAFEVRFCSRTTVFENRILERGVTPGFGVLWSLAQHLGQAAMLDLTLNRRSLDAEEALKLKLVTHVSNDDHSAGDAIQYSEQMANRPIAVVKGLAKARAFLHCDFESYINQVGGGFTKLPPA